MFGGDGNDQLVTDYPCAAHHFSGGAGHDIAGFARSGTWRIHAQLGGPSSNPMPFHGRAFNPDLCPDFQRWGTRIDGDLEVLEGAEGDDVLVGDDGPNTIWGRTGNDVLVGQGGDDELAGLEGDDVIDGGSGHDRLLGGAGRNTLHARDGERDDEISCGSGGGTADIDRFDPAPVGCQ